MRHVRYVSYFAIVLSVLAGCGASGSGDGNSPEPPPLVKAPSTGEVSPEPDDENATVSKTPQVVDIEGVKFTIPAGWKRVDLMPAQAGIIAARYLIPVEGNELQLTFTTARGGIPANFDRWKGQFQLAPGIEPLEDRITLSEGEAYWLDLRGTFRAGGSVSGDGPQEDTRMLGVGIPLANREMYLKLLGPSSQVATITDAMRKLVKSADLP